MPHNHLKKIEPLGIRRPKSHPLAMTQASKQKIPFDMFYIFYLQEPTESLVKKSLKFTLSLKFKDI